MATIISLASRSPRCLNCMFWTGSGPRRWCDFADEQTNSDWCCDEFRRRSIEER